MYFLKYEYLRRRVNTPLYDKIWGWVRTGGRGRGGVVSLNVGI